MTNNSETIDNALDDEIVQGILNSFTDLREYSKQVEGQLAEAEKQSIQDYINESDNIAKLHKQISCCDGILERMETMLIGFQTDLGSISSEILALQRKSVSMSQELSNRQSIRGQLSQFIDDMVVPENLIEIITYSPVTDKDFLQQLQNLNHKISFVKEQSFKETKACEDVIDVLEKLKIKAMSKIRTYLMEQVYKFRKPMANYQIPQANMLKYKFFYEFILANERNVAHEICTEYVDTMGKIYYSYFKSYSGRIMKLQYEEAVTKDNLMGVMDEIGNRTMFNKSLKHKSTIFTIGNRGDILAQQLEAPIIVPHAQVKNRYPFEALFRSEQYAVVDNACREYLFIGDFFMVKGPQALDLFNRTMGKTLQLLRKQLDTFVVDCYDSISLFLCFHLVLRYKLMCHKRCVPALDDYWTQLEGIILPRFEFIFRLNIDSVRNVDVLKMAPEMGPHFISRRYAEFSGALVGISEHFPNELVSRLLAELREEIDMFIVRMAGIFNQRRDQLIFLINNYDLILSIIMEHTRDNSKEAETFKARLAHHSSQFVEEILSPHFGELMQFVREQESRANENGAIDERKCLAIVEHFSNTWKKSLEQLNREVLLSFPNLVTGSNLLQLALTQLVQYYHRFHRLLPSHIKSQLTNIHLIMVEMRKYKTNY